MRSGRRIHFEFSLATDLIYGGFVSELGHELIGLDVNILLAWGSLWCLDISREELFGSLGSLLLQTLWIILSLVGLEELIGVGARWDNHSCIGAAAEDTLIERDVLWEVLLSIRPSVGILVLLLLGDDSGMRSKPLPTCTTAGLLQHF